MTTHKKNYSDFLLAKFPELAKAGSEHGLQFENLIDENLLSPFTVNLPKDLLAKIQSTIKTLFKVRQQTEYSSWLQRKYQKNVFDPGNYSMFMSYDFHLDANNTPKIIEINTNAAFLGLGYYFYECLNKSTGLQFKINDLKSNFLEELKLFGSATSNPRIAITDENPSQQRLFAEFLIYQQLTKSFGWDCEISDFRSVTDLKPDFIYNRWTDFYFDKSESSALRDSYLSKKICYSPNPHEYFLLADKQRLMDFNNLEFHTHLKLSEEQIKIIKSAVPLTKVFSDFDRSDLWNQRKNLFFKPINSFGSKQTYKGASISRKLFDELPNQDFLAQEYIPAPEMTFETPEGPDSFKFDLRCYAYQDELQMVIARIYKGQVTNLKTKYGGFALVNWN